MPKPKNTPTPPAIAAELQHIEHERDEVSNSRIVNSSSADAGPAAEAEQRLPANSQQDVSAASEQTDNKGADAGASLKPDDELMQGNNLKPAPLFAVTKVNLAGRYYEPDMQLDEPQIEKAGDQAIVDLLLAGAIREG